MAEGQTAEQQALARQAMEADGISSEETVYEDYFGFDERHKVTLPDGKQWVEFKVMTEGERRHYLNSTNRAVTIAKNTGDAKMDMKPGDERHALLRETICDWEMYRGGQKVPFNKNTLNEFLDKANPRVVDRIEKEVRKRHPWLMAEMTVEDIDREIANLEEMREIVIKEEEGNVSSASK